MPSTLATGDTMSRTLDDAFLDVIYSDSDLLTAEFDAIVAGAWPSPPAEPPERGATARRPAGRAAHRASAPAPGGVSRPRHPGVDDWSRSRSPPDTGSRKPSIGRKVVANA